MSKGDWLDTTLLVLIAGCVLVLMSALAGSLLLEQYAKVHEVNAAYQQNAERDRHASANEVAEQCGNRQGEAFRICVLEHLETYYRDQATNEDLNAQKDMAYWAGALFFSSTILTGMGIWLLWLTLMATRDTLKEARNTTFAAIAAADSASEANMIMREESRAWLSVKIIVHRIYTYPEKIRLEVGIEYENIGKNVCDKVFSDLKHIEAKVDSANLFKTIKDKSVKWFQEYTESDSTIVDFSFMIPPSGKYVTTIIHDIKVQIPPIPENFVTSIPVGYRTIYKANGKIRHASGCMTINLEGPFYMPLDGYVEVANEHFSVQDIAACRYIT